MHKKLTPYSSAYNLHTHFQGFTLIEILVVLGFVLVIGFLSFIPLKNFQSTLTLDSVTQDMVETLRFAQNQTVASTENNQYGVHFATTSYALFQGASYTEGDPSNIIHVLPANTQITGIVLEGGDEVLFNRVDGGTPNGGTLSITAFHNGIASRTTTVAVNGLGKVIANEGESGDLVIDVSNAKILGEGNKHLRDIKLTNAGSDDVVIEKMIISWSDTDRLLHQISIDNSTVWHHTDGTGLPQGAQSSGTEIDIVDYTLSAGMSVFITSIEFDGNINDNFFVITLKLADGTQKTVTIDFSNGGAFCSSGEHVHYAFNWGIKNANFMTIDFTESGGGTYTHTIDFQDYVSGNVFAWEDTVLVDGEPQTLRIHTHDMAPSETLFCVHRDDNEVTKPFTVTIDGSLIASYTIDGDVSAGTNVLCQSQ